MGDDDLGHHRSKWRGGCAAPPVIIYCLPERVNMILAIDPLKEYVLSLKMDIRNNQNSSDISSTLVMISLTTQSVKLITVKLLKASMSFGGMIHAYQ